MKLLSLVLAAAIVNVLLMPFSAPAQENPQPSEAVFATVNGQSITMATLQSTYANYMRQTYYHRQVPEGEVEQAKQTVRDMVIDRVLLLMEANRRGLVADEEQIAKTIAEYDARYGDSERWKLNRDMMLVGVRQQLAEQSLLSQIESIGRTIPEPTEPEVRTYYGAHTELFTEPEKLRLHTILLRVDPSSNRATWDAAREESQRIFKNIQSGASFEDMARLHSNDPSADNGGDMGYMHVGMIPDGVVEKILETRQGDITPPMDVLEGIALFRLDERVLPKLQPFENVTERARDLLKREQVETAWTQFKLALRKGADIKILEGAPPAPAATNP